jgi:hypothetical protein
MLNKEKNAFCESFYSATGRLEKYRSHRSLGNPAVQI